MKRERGDAPTIAIDTREQRPYPFRKSVRVTLDTGDYSAVGVENLLRIERKSLPDFIGCVGASRERFERCLSRLSLFPWPHVVLEFSMADLTAGAWSRSLITPSQAVASALAWGAHYRIPFWFCGDREHAAAVVMKLATFAVRHAARAAAAGIEPARAPPEEAIAPRATGP